MPSLLEWLSYVFASGNLLAGPFFELKDHQEYFQREADGFPSSVAAGLRRLLKALLCMGLYLRMTKAPTPQPFSQPLLSRCYKFLLVCVCKGCTVKTMR